MSESPEVESEEKKETKEADTPSSAKNKKTPSPKKEKSETKSPAKKKEESEGEDEEEEHIGLLDQPLEVEGKRRRSETQRLVVAENISHKREGPEYKGKGTPLGDIPYVNAMLDKHKGLELRPLYRICFRTMGKKETLKRELKKFNGFAFDKKSPDYGKRKEALNKLTRSELDVIRRTLGTEKKPKKEDEVEVILDWLVVPTDSGRSAPKAKGTKRKSSAKGKKEKSAKRTKSEKKRNNEEEESGSDGDGDSEDEKEEEEEEKEVKAKKTLSRPKATPKKTPAKKKEKSESSKKEVKKEEKEEAESESESTSSDSQDNVKSPTLATVLNEQAEEAKKSLPMPSEDEILTKIGELLKTFDLTQVSMKQMVIAVTGAFPDTNVVEKTPFIKQSIKKAIAQME